MKEKDAKKRPREYVNVAVKLLTHVFGAERSRERRGACVGFGSTGVGVVGCLTSVSHVCQLNLSPSLRQHLQKCKKQRLFSITVVYLGCRSFCRFNCVGNDHVCSLDMIMSVTIELYVYQIKYYRYFKLYKYTHVCLKIVSVLL